MYLMRHLFYLSVPIFAYYVGAGCSLLQVYYLELSEETNVSLSNKTGVSNE
jgi:hypothetical protein